MGHGEPSKGFQVVAGCIWFFLDAVLVACLLFRYGMSGWADAYDDPANAAAPAEARRAAWILLGSGVVSGGCLLLRRYWVPGVLQLLLLGAAAGVLAFFAARR